MLYSKKVATLFAASALALTIGLVGCGGSAQPQQTTTETTTEATTQTTTEETKPEATTTQTEAAPQATTEEAKPQATTQTTEAPAPSNPADSYIGNEEAARIALADAGFAAGDVYDLDSELDLDDAVVHYDVDFKSGNMEYDYDIDAVSGAIISSNAEIDD